MRRGLGRFECVTLHLTLTSGLGVLQVSDRLVSVNTKRGIEPFDRTANKTVIYFARDAYLTIGYTGLAYLEDRPTDQWIAEKLIGEEVESRRGPSGGIPQQFIAGPMPAWSDIGLARRRLRDALIAATGRLPPDLRPHFPQIIIAGWQAGKRVMGDRRRWRPIMDTIADDGVGVPYGVMSSLPRHGWERTRFSVNPTPYFPGLFGPLAQLVKSLRGARSEDEAEEQMVKVLRLAADSAPKSIGKDFLSVFLPPPAAGFVRTRYVAFDDEIGTLEGPGDEGGGYVGPVGYTPWVVHPYYQAGPAIRVGSQAWVIGSPLGSFEFRSENPSSASEGSLFIAFGSQPRMPPPR
jgi:hypothetical protein